ncbi:hypothetical protein [Pedobacter lusitanus]|uniref:hypothetical protein n=1 Tax=Pedobacter lusitanus TaxID=1503925 RepID=UPI000AB417F9|nr:hypothetical protein [Pedobacter lusitanus]
MELLLFYGQDDDKSSDRYYHSAYTYTGINQFLLDISKGYSKIQFKHLIDF